MKINPIALSIRAKKLGVLIRDARLASGKSIAECAEAIGVTEADFEEFEVGSRSPSLPELELLAYALEVPMEHFWSDTALTGEGDDRSRLDPVKLVHLRTRIIGAMMRQARMEAGLSLEDLAEMAASSPSVIESYELGDVPVPLPDLEVISSALNRSLKDFEDKHGPVGKWSAQQRALKEFEKLSPDLQAFVSRPINRPYLEVAQRLSEMSVEKLRAVAEGLLEITL